MVREGLAIGLATIQPVDDDYRILGNGQWQEYDEIFQKWTDCPPKLELLPGRERIGGEFYNNDWGWVKLAPVQPADGNYRIIDTAQEPGIWQIRAGTNSWVDCLPLPHLLPKRTDIEAEDEGFWDQNLGWCILDPDQPINKNYRIILSEKFPNKPIWQQLVEGRWDKCAPVPNLLPSAKPEENPEEEFDIEVDDSVDVAYVLEALYKFDDDGPRYWSKVEGKFVNIYEATLFSPEEYDRFAGKFLSVARWRAVDKDRWEEIIEGPLEDKKASEVFEWAFLDSTEYDAPALDEETESESGYGPAMKEHELELYCKKCGYVERGLKTKEVMSGSKYGCPNDSSILRLSPKNEEDKEGVTWDYDDSGIPVRIGVPELKTPGTAKTKTLEDHYRDAKFRNWQDWDDDGYADYSYYKGTGLKAYEPKSRLAGEIPIGTPGKLYHGGRYMGQGEIEKSFEDLKSKNVTVIWNLLEDSAGWKDESENFEIVIATPIRDYGLPNNKTKFFEDAKYVLALLKEGRNVYVHCMAGHGRTGTAVATLLIMSGMSIVDGIEMAIDNCHGPETEDQIYFVVDLFTIDKPEQQEWWDFRDADKKAQEYLNILKTGQALKNKNVLKTEPGPGTTIQGPWKGIGKNQFNPSNIPSPWTQEQIETYEKEEAEQKEREAKLREIEEAKELGMHKTPLKARVKEISEPPKEEPKITPKKYRRPVKWNGPKKGGLVEGMALRAALSAIPVIRTDLGLWGIPEIAMQEQRIFDALIFAKAEEFLHYAANVIKEEMRHYQGSSETKRKMDKMYWSAVRKFKNYAGAYADFLYKSAKLYSELDKWSGGFGGHPWAAFSQHMGDLSVKLDEYSKTKEQEQKIESTPPGSTAEALRNVMAPKKGSEKLVGEILAMLNVADGMCHNNAPYIDKMLRREHVDTGGMGSGRSESDTFDTEYDDIMESEFGAKTGQKISQERTSMPGKFYPGIGHKVREQLNVIFPQTKKEGDDLEKKERQYRALLNSKELSNQLDKLQFVLPFLKSDPSNWWLFKETYGKGIENLHREYREKNPGETPAYDFKRIQREMELSEKKKHCAEQFYIKWTQRSRPVLIKIEELKADPTIGKTTNILDKINSLASQYGITNQLQRSTYNGPYRDRGLIIPKTIERVRLIIDESGKYEGRPVLLAGDEIPTTVLAPKPEGGHIAVSEANYGRLQSPITPEQDPEEIQEEIEQTEGWRTSPFKTKTRQPEPKAEVYNVNHVVNRIIQEACFDFTTIVRAIGDSALNKELSKISVDITGEPERANED